MIAVQNGRRLVNAVEAFPFFPVASTQSSLRLGWTKIVAEFYDEAMTQCPGSLVGYFFTTAILTSDGYCFEWWTAL